jgi:hypothetical protein
LLFGVAGLKNAFQLVVISETVDALPPLAPVAGDDGADAAADVGAAAGADDAGAEEELELLEHADIAVARMSPSAGAR